MLKKICVWSFSALLSVTALSVNAATVELGGNGSGVKVKIVGAGVLNGSAATAFANIERVQVALILPSDTTDTTLQTNCGYNKFGSPLGNLIVAVKPWYPLIPSSSGNAGVSQVDQLKQAQYNNILAMASSAALSQVDVWVSMDSSTCEIGAFVLSP